MSDFDHDSDGQHDKKDGVSRRKVLECMTWAGTGILWTTQSAYPSDQSFPGRGATSRNSCAN
jgi:hypothetical protein